MPQGNTRVINPLEPNPNQLGVSDTRTITVRAHARALNGAPGAEVSAIESVGDGNRIRYQNGAIYVSAHTAPAWVYGAIGERYDGFGGSAGWLGMPITDETGTPDGRGRYNHFENGSIYWTQTTGAFEVHGAIRDKWASLGWETSFLGYPTTDETGAPAGPGRFNSFEGGSIYWTAAAGAFEVHSQTLPNSIHRHGDIRFEDSTAAGGWADIVLNSDGTFLFSGHLHDSGAFDYSDSVACVAVATSTATAYTFVHNGQMRGTLTPGSRDDDWSESGARQELSTAWTDLGASLEVTFQTKVDWDPAGWVDTIKALYPYVQAVVALL